MMVHLVHIVNSTYKYVRVHGGAQLLAQTKNRRQCYEFLSGDLQTDVVLQYRGYICILSK